MEQLTPHSVLLTDRVAVVTGAAQGIGEAAAITLARFGAHVAVCDKLAGPLAGTVAEIDELDRHHVSSVMDVRDDESVRSFLGEVSDVFGHVDILVNNAGGGFWGPFMDVNAKGQSALVDENFTQVTNFIRGVVPLMPDRGGSIINVTSVEAFRAGPGFAIYSAMKAAVENLSKSLALELASRRVRVNCVAPDLIPTPGDSYLVEASGASEERGWALQPLQDEGSPFDVAASVVFLASDLARFITGTTLHVDGGTFAAGGWKRSLSDGSWSL